jgi:hypothetical protein
MLSSLDWRKFLTAQGKDGQAREYLAHFICFPQVPILQDIPIQKCFSAPRQVG